MANPLTALQNYPDTTVVNLIYTGGSFGALGVTRSQEEHELVTEQANKENYSFKLVSHACWRAVGLAVFLPSDEPKGNELSKILKQKDSATIYKVEGFKSLNALLLQDPQLTNPNLLDMMKRNPRQTQYFPDLNKVDLTVYALTVKNGEPAYIVEEQGAIWPTRIDLWTKGEVNRIDIEGASARLFELPINLGEMAVRSTLLQKIKSSISNAPQVLVDLGHQTGYLGVDLTERAQIDYSVLNQLGYSIVVPYHFELMLGAQYLGKLLHDYKEIRLLATNIKSKDTTLFHSHLILNFNNIKVGFVGLVDPGLQSDLPKNSLQDFQFLPLLESIDKEIAYLKHSGVDAIIALSNFDASENAILGEKIVGVDAIVANLQKRLTPTSISQTAEFVPRNKTRPGAPNLIANSFSNGIGIGILEMKFDSINQLQRISNLVYPVTDETIQDSVVLDSISRHSTKFLKNKGDLMFPAFIDLIAVNPAIKNHDQITRQGRISQQLWEDFVARLLRKAGPAEITIIKKFSHFPPLIGKLHEDEVKSWLWTEENLILCDIKGDALLKLLADDINEDLVFSGLIKPAITKESININTPHSLSSSWYKSNIKVMGRSIDPEAYYKIATTDVVYEGIRASNFLGARRVRRNFYLNDSTGKLIETPLEQPLSLRSFVLDELKRIRKFNKGEKYLNAISQELKPDPKFEPLLTFSFDNPTLWTSYNTKFNSDGYGSVPESRISSTNSWVIGASGRFKVTMDKLKSALDLGITLAYARQNNEINKSFSQISESADDIKLDLTYRKKSAGKIQSFLRSQYDTEFTPTINPTNQEINLRQKALRGVIGFTKRPTSHWRNIEFASILEQDFSQNKAQFGFTAKADGRFKIGKGNVIYNFRNEATYFLHSRLDTNKDLALRYNMVHELIVPLVDELALSVGADMFFFKGKVTETNALGTSMLMRIGITYNRLWKPRYQSLF